jgi:Protein of unknown function (DUF2608)
MDIPVIDSFDSIAIVPNTLVICDIDDTLLRITEDENSHSLYSRLHQHYLRITKNPIVAGKLADNEYYAQYPMQATDAAGFERMLAKIRQTEGCELVFLTARSPNTVDFTVENFRQIGLVPEDHIVHFSDMIPKGKYTKAKIELAPFAKIVFIDDMKTNLENMRMHVSHPGLELFLFRYRK